MPVIPPAPLSPHLRAGCNDRGLGARGRVRTRRTLRQFDCQFLRGPVRQGAQCAGGDEKGARRFIPGKIELETGKLYRLVLSNPSPEKHYFNSDGFSRAVYTRKVQVNGRDGKPVAEFKGFVREIEVFPGSTTAWWLVPIKTGQFGDLKCTEQGHTEAGMVGQIVIK